MKVHFDDEEEWSLFYAPGCVMFYENLLHELGHALGLKHSLKYPSIMSVYYFNGKGSSSLQNDDISRMRKLYGEFVGQTRLFIHSVNGRVAS